MVDVRRSELDIIIEILKLSRNGTKKTNILYKGNLSYTQIQNYLPFLIKKQILEEYLVEEKDKNYKFYKITPKGLDLLQSARKTLTLLKWSYFFN